MILEKSNNYDNIKKKLFKNTRIVEIIKNINIILITLESESKLLETNLCNL